MQRRHSVQTESAPQPATFSVLSIIFQDSWDMTRASRAKIGGGRSWFEYVSENGSLFEKQQTIPCDRNKKHLGYLE